MKKLFLPLLLALALAGCGEKEQASADSGPSVGFAPPGDASAVEREETVVNPNHDVAIPEAADGEEVVIREKLFVAQTNDIYLNREKYLGRTIRYEGIYKESVWEANETTTLHYVIRYGPGCCGYDGEAGFEVLWDTPQWPEQDDWVEVVGKIELVKDGEYEFLVVRVESMTVKEERGQETVTT